MSHVVGTGLVRARGVRLLNLRAPSGADLVWVDRVIGLLLLIGIELQVWLNPYIDRRLPAALAGCVLAAGVAVRRRLPLGAPVVASVAVTAQRALGGGLTEHAVGALAAVALIFYAAGAFTEERGAWLALLVGLAGVGADTAIAGEPVANMLFAAIVLLLLPWLAGRMLRERGARERAQRERAERLDAGRERQLQAAALAERTRIARELHDVIAHCVSVMVIQAGAARAVLEPEPERAEQALRSVERAGHDALAEMRRLLGVLDPGGDPGELAPQPGLAELHELVAGTRAAGVATELWVEGAPEALAPALDLCVYRIVQEALTNTIKHAGPASAAVHLRWCGEMLELDVSDDGRGPALDDEATSNGGHGIAGMRERVALHGGTLQATAGTAGGFAVRARLPVSREAL